MTKAIEILNRITDVILAYRPKAKNKKGRKAKIARRKTVAVKKID